ncbi:MAG: radical SAM protein [Calditrichaeota bacterium]|nr:MAG: radical SAM protein [Calditrichota bacterium]
MNVLLTHGYFLPLDPKEAALHRPYPPLASLTMAAWLKEKLGLEVHFYDVMFDGGPEGLVQAVRKHRPDVLIVYDDDFNFLTKMCLENMRRTVFAAVAQLEQVPLRIVHSSDASDQAEAYLQAGFQVVVHRNAEKALVDLLAAYRRRPSLEALQHMPSLSLNTANGIVHTPPLRQNFPPEETPFPRWELIDLEPYRRQWLKHHSYFSLNVSTSHGCPYGCNWCAKPLYGRTYRAIPPERVAEEFRRLKVELGADHIWVTDDIFALQPGWLERFARELERRQIHVPYKCLSRADLITEPFAALLARTGCQEIWLGVESGSQRVLDAMDKRLRVTDAIRARQILGNHGIRTCFFLQFGYLGETLADIQATWRLIRHTRPSDIGISVSYPLKGTPFYQTVQNLLGAKRNWLHSGDLDLMYPGTYPRSFYREVYRFTHLMFGWIRLRQAQPLGGQLRLLVRQIIFLPELVLRYLRIRWTAWRKATPPDPDWMVHKVRYSEK